MPSPVAIDCEMVTCRLAKNQQKKVNLAGQVTLIDFNGNILLHTYAKPPGEIINYNTQFSGILPEHLANAPPLADVSARIASIIAGRILVGFAVQNDLHALRIRHPPSMTIDMQKEKYVQWVMCTDSPSLKRTTHALLGIEIQNGAHSSYEDARATMQLYHVIGSGSGGL